MGQRSSKQGEQACEEEAARPTEALPSISEHEAAPTSSKDVTIVIPSGRTEPTPVPLPDVQPEAIPSSSKPSSSAELVPEAPTVSRISREETMVRRSLDSLRPDPSEDRQISPGEIRTQRDSKDIAPAKVRLQVELHQQGAAQSKTAGQASAAPVQRVQGTKQLSERETALELFHIGGDRSGRISTSKSMKAMRGSDIGEDLPEDSSSDDGASVVQKVMTQLGTIAGVFLPCTQNILGIILFIRLPWVVGQAGIGMTLGIVLMCCSCTFLTGLSLSAIATNGTMKGGGPYFLIGRALGPEFGVSIGLCFYLGTTIASSMYILGAVETVFSALPGLMIFGRPADPSFDIRDMQIYGICIGLFLIAAVLMGVKYIARLGPTFLFPVILSILFIFIGIVTAPRGDTPAGITGLKRATFSDNFHPNFTVTDSQGNPDPDGAYAWDFQNLLALFFPSVTGIMAGSNRSGSLRDASQSIPIGTLGAILMTSTLYLGFVMLYGSCADRQYLLSERLLAAKVAWPTSSIVSVGITLSTLGAGLQSMMGAPRLITSIANDRILPFLDFFVTQEGQEPRRAIVLTGSISLGCVCIGNLDTITPIITMFFLLCYMGTNLSCALLHLINAPSWRPRWQYYHWTLSTLGVCLCFTIMVLISWLFTILALLLAAFMYWYVSSHGSTDNWGDGLKSLRLNVAVKTLQNLNSAGQAHPKNWYPIPLVLCKPWGILGSDVPCHPKLLSFAKYLEQRGTYGAMVIVSILAGEYGDKADEAYEAAKLLREHIDEMGSAGFSDVIVAPSVAAGFKGLIQSCGLGQLKPNLIVMRYPDRWKKIEHVREKIPEQFLEIVRDSYTAGKGVIMIKGLDTFPEPSERMRGTIDLYWITRDGGLMLLLSQLLQRHPVWSQCTMRLFAVAEHQSELEELRSDIKQFLYDLRMSGEVIVLTPDNADECPECGHQKTDFKQQLEKTRKRLLRTEAVYEGTGVTGSPSGLVRRTMSSESDGDASEDERDSGRSSLDQAPSPMRKSRRALVGGVGGAGLPVVPSGQKLAGMEDLEDGFRPARSMPHLSPEDEQKVDECIFTSLKLNACVKLHSKQAALVLMSLPPPFPKQSSNPSKYYMEYIDLLVKDIPRALIVRGYRREVLTIFS